MDLVLPEKLSTDIGSVDILVFEGFEMTGKSYLAKQVHDQWPSALYRPDWEGALSDKVVRRGNRFIPGLVVLDLLRSIREAHCQPPMIILDRWLAVSYVYRVLYGQASDCSNLEDMVESFKLAASPFNVVIVHKSHADKADAQRMFSTSVQDSDHSDQYDRFSSFEDYWQKYNQFNSEYLKFYEDKCPFHTYELSSYGNIILHEWGCREL